MRLARTNCAVATCVSLIAGSTVLAAPLALDPAGIPAFTGSAPFNAADMLRVDLDYAVFAPGAYRGTLDPSAAEEYLYAYQAFNTSTNQALSSVTIGLALASDAGNASADPSYGAPGGVTPTMFSLLETSMVTRFLAPQVLPAAHSTVFYFTSPNPPTFMPASVAGGGYSDQLLLPSPVPEPATCGLLALGGLLILARKRTQC